MEKIQGNLFRGWISDVVQAALGARAAESEPVLLSDFPLLSAYWFLTPRKGHYGDRQTS